MWVICYDRSIVTQIIEYFVLQLSVIREFNWRIFCFVKSFVAGVFQNRF